MLNCKLIFDKVRFSLCLDASAEELDSISYRILQASLGLSKASILAKMNVPVQSMDTLTNFITRVNLHEPIQYILEEEEFYGRKFHVNPHVLIPRPETECLVNEVLSVLDQEQKNNVRVLDVGTGSGCIAITLMLERSYIQAMGTDISKKALKMAKKNALYHQANIVFEHLDVLTRPLPQYPFDVIVSNPPYVTPKEKSEMRANVLAYEPPQALFVPQQSPLIFYETILSKSREVLTKRGILAVEINERYGREVVEMFKKYAYRAVTLSQDYAGKDRIICARYG